MRRPREFGDDNTLIGFAILTGLTVHVLTPLGDPSVQTVCVPEMFFGDEYQPRGEAWIAVEPDHHFWTTRRLPDANPARTSASVSDPASAFDSAAIANSLAPSAALTSSPPAPAPTAAAPPSTEPPPGNKDLLRRMVKMKNAAWGSGYLGDQRLIYGIVDKYHPRDKTFRIWFAPPYRTGEIWVSRDMLLGKCPYDATVAEADAYIELLDTDALAPPLPSAVIRGVAEAVASYRPPPRPSRSTSCRTA